MKTSTSINTGNIMQRTFIGAAVAAALTLTGVSAHASCADPRVAQSAPAAIPAAVLQSFGATGSSSGGSPTIVGTWQVTYTVEGGPFGQALIQWHSDGTEWENINLPVLSGNICLGSWVWLDSRHVHRNHMGWLYTNGTLSGYFTETENDELSSDGSSYAGTNQQNIYNLSGVLQLSVTGTSAARRLYP